MIHEVDTVLEEEESRLRSRIFDICNIDTSVPRAAPKGFVIISQ